MRHRQFSAIAPLWYFVTAMRKEPEPSEQFQSMLSALRDDGMSYRQIAAEAGVSHASIWRIAQGETSRPSYQVGFAIERTFRARRTDAR